MRVWLLALVACGVEPTAVEPAPTPVVIAPKPVAPKPPPPPPKLTPAIHAVHASPISMLVVTDDGTAALTSDVGGSLRLWPTLDGTREPIVLRGPVPIDLALGRTPTQLVAGLVDQAGVLTLVHLDGEGHALDHVQAATDVLGLHATSQGFLILTTDQRIELVSYAGVRAPLPAKERVVALVYRNSRALVLHESSPKHVRGRWIDLTAGAKWGDETAELALDAKHVDLKHGVLSPDHTRLAVAGPGDRLLAFELATAVATSLSTICDPLGYLDDDTLECSDGNGIAFIDRNAKRLGYKRDTSPEAIAVADHRLAFGLGESIGLADPKTTQYLGYNVAAARKVHDSVVGLVFSGGQHTFVTDDKLAFTKIIHDPPRQDTTVLDVLPLSAKLDAALLMTEETTQYVVVNNRTLFDIVRDGDIHFEPATGLLAEASEGTTRFVRVANDKLGPPFEIATSTSPLAMYFADSSETPDKVFLTDPALADGRVAMIVHDNRVLELRDADLRAKKIHASKSYEVAGGIVAIDRVGHIFTKRGKGEVKLNGGDVHFANTTDVTATVPSPDGKLVAFASPGTVALFAIDGTLRWRVKIGDRALGWTHDGRLLAVSGGSETLDLETGESIDRHCGWGFGLSAKPVEDASQFDLVCER
ncbi:MAG TPA: hypothetical protein VF403_18030 [Kofleriaceae bacterium]